MCSVPRRRVVITGMGCVTPVGNDLETARRAVLAGVSGCAAITLLDHARFDAHFANEVKNFDPARHMDEKVARRTARFVQFAVAASREAVAGLSCPVPERAGAIYASGAGGIRIIEEQYEVFKARGAKRVSAIGLPTLMINNAPARLAMDFNLKGPNYAVASGCAGALSAIALAFRHIQWNEADVMLAGGAEAGISVMLLAGLANLGALSKRVNQSPAAASRPFDRDRDGIVPGEGGGALLLEELGHALARNAPIFAEVKGFGFSDDAFDIARPEPDGDGVLRAMRRAVADSGLTPGDIDYIGANGASSRTGDRAEARAVERLFGKEAGRPAVGSTKGHVGHLLGASGAVEAIMTVLSIRDGVAAPILNFAAPDPECGIDIVAGKPREMTIRHALVNSFGLGGQNASLCLGRYEK